MPSTPTPPVPSATPGVHAARSSEALVVPPVWPASSSPTPSWVTCAATKASTTTASTRPSNWRRVERSRSVAVDVDGNPADETARRVRRRAPTRTAPRWARRVAAHHRRHAEPLDGLRTALSYVGRAPTSPGDRHRPRRARSATRSGSVRRDAACCRAAGGCVRDSRSHPTTTWVGLPTTSAC